jgi:hypothetical protein
VKRLGGVWPAITAFDNLLLAYRKACRGKANRPAVAYFGLDQGSGAPNSLVMDGRGQGW